MEQMSEKQAALLTLGEVRSISQSSVPCPHPWAHLLIYIYRLL